MRTNIAWLGALLLTTACTSGGVEATHGRPAELRNTKATPTRSFHMRYVTDLRDMPLGETLRLWIPIPGDDSHQTIRNLDVTAPWVHRVTREPVHGNRMLYFEATAETAHASVTVEYDVDRAEVRIDRDAYRTDGDEQPGAWQQYLDQTRLVVMDENLRAISERIAPASGGTLARARVYYDHVLEEMVYDKSGEGWGHGDSLYACSVGKGNCTDFHSYFKSLCMAAGIPTRFQIGMWGRYERRPGEAYESSSYHCWAEFHVPGRGWVPVDISEADKDPGRADEFFGGHSDNRCTLSTGRDIVLAPAQAGEPLNYFVDPYAEIGGKAFGGVSKTPYWTDLR